jgi:hypothetical protein
MTGTELIVSGGVGMIAIKEAFTFARDVIAKRNGNGNGNGNGKECAKGVLAKLEDIERAQEVRGAAEIETTKAKIAILEQTRDSIQEMAKGVAVLVDRSTR